jgi:hypothetical protein
MSTKSGNASDPVTTPELRFASELEPPTHHQDGAKPRKSGLKIAFAMLLLLVVLVYLNMG